MVFEARELCLEEEVLVVVGNTDACFRDDWSVFVVPRIRLIFAANPQREFRSKAPLTPVTKQLASEISNVIE